MSKVLNFNEQSTPTLLIVMKDDAQTKVHVTAPTLALVKELRRSLPALQKVFEGEGPDTVKATYDLAARLLSCNLDFLKFEAEELAVKYGLGAQDLIIFYTAYLDFLEGIENEKN